MSQNKQLFFFSGNQKKKEGKNSLELKKIYKLKSPDSYSDRQTNKQTNKQSNRHDGHKTWKRDYKISFSVFLPFLSFFL